MDEPAVPVEKTEAKKRSKRSKPEPADGCASCRFWKRDEETGAELGICRESPPQVLSDEDSAISLWPTTCTTDWCGKYQKLTH